MSKKGGYRILDFKGFELLNSPMGQGKAEVLNEVNKNDKVLLLSGMVYNGEVVKDTFALYSNNRIMFSLNGEIVYISTEGTTYYRDYLMDTFNDMMTMNSVSVRTSYGGPLYLGSDTEVIENNASVQKKITLTDSNYYKTGDQWRSATFIVHQPINEKTDGLVAVFELYNPATKEATFRIYNNTGNAVTGYKFLLGIDNTIYVIQRRNRR